MSWSEHKCIRALEKKQTKNERWKENHSKKQTV